ncbi:MAG TPA: sodium/solute symporter [Acidobacteriaceae bacterium]|nr:sodium/solute symporter [Acidobacteriaceae bacterium]
MPNFFRASLGIAILPAYFATTILIGWLTRRRSSGSANAFLNASRALPLPLVTAAFLAANCGALEVVGMSAMAAQYGAEAFHFYCIGAIPAMIFLSIWMMPVYRRSGIRSVPEYLEYRYGAGIRLVNACVLAVTSLLFAGISLYAIAQVLQVVAGIRFAASALVAGGVVLVYVLLGGVRATIYNQVLQLGVMIAGLLPLTIRYWSYGAWVSDERRDHMWRGLPVVSHMAPMDALGIIVGLGFVLSFGYWCTDFVLMQRAFAARTDDAARQVPLWAGFGKLGFSMLVVVPGLAAHRLLPELGHSQRFDQALPALMRQSYGPSLLGLGLTAIAASLMSALAANVSAFAALWTEDIYQAHLVRQKPDRHYLIMGRVATVTAVLVSILASYFSFLFSDLMEHVQMIFSVFGAPFFAIFLLGMTTRRTTERGAIIGFLSGTAIALLHLAAFSLGWLHYGSVMSANFYAAMYAFGAAVLVAWITSVRGPAGITAGVRLQMDFSLRGTPRLLWLLSILLIFACVGLNAVWR